MRVIDCGTSPTVPALSSLEWPELGLLPPWDRVVEALRPGDAPRTVQVEAISRLQVLETRKNVIISAPTNAGKSLIGILVLLDAVRRKRRAVLLEPLRALAREKADELDAVAPVVGRALGTCFDVRITTGDYRLNDETLAECPPDKGELLVATPERLEAILRNPRHDDWISTIGAVCVDEAHLIASPHRGPTLEFLLTSLLGLSAPPRLILLSGTLGNVDRAREWLAPCDVVCVRERYPALEKRVVELGPEDDANRVVIELVTDALVGPSANVLVFVYQTGATERLAALLREHLGSLAGIDGPLAYHAQMGLSQRQAVRNAFQSGRSRCVVSTTALGLGVNLPATHVIVRDPTFPGVGPVGAADLLQMMGRAGRGDQPGTATVIVRPGDAWEVRDLARALETEALPDLVSHFELRRGSARRGQRDEAAFIRDTAAHVAAQLARRPEDGRSAEDLCLFFKRSLGGCEVSSHVRPALGWLSDPSRLLLFEGKDGRHRLTVLGLAATRSVLPLSLAAGLGQLIRDLLSVDPSDTLLGGWQPLDHLVVLELLREHAPSLRRFSSDLVRQVDSWMEASPGRSSLLYREWLAGDRVDEVFGSLGIAQPVATRGMNSPARQAAYLALLRGMVIYDRGLGGTTEDLERRWQLIGLDGIEERWRDELLWLLSGTGNLFDLRCFFFHLREQCGADRERVQRVKRLLRRLRAQSFELREQLKYCSPLGPVLRSLHRTDVAGGGPAVGIQTIRRLEAAGVGSVQDLARLQLSDLCRLGVRRDLARQIQSYLRRRLQ